MRRAIRKVALLAVSPILIAQPRHSRGSKPITLEEAPLSSQVRTDILAAVQSDWNDGELNLAQQQQAALKSPVKFLRLGLGRAPTIEVESDESPSCGVNDIGNCPVYLFAEVDDRAVLIFQAAAQGIDILPTRHHGMYDISVADRLNHFMHVAFQVDEFDGKTYEAAYCYETDIDGSGHFIKTPHRKC